MAMNGVLVPTAVTVPATVAGGSTTWVEAPGVGTFTPEVHITVRSNVSGDVETVLETFPGLHLSRGQPPERGAHAVDHPELPLWSDYPADWRAAGRPV